MPKKTRRGRTIVWCAECWSGYSSCNQRRETYILQKCFGFHKSQVGSACYKITSDMLKKRDTWQKKVSISIIFILINLRILLLVIKNCSEQTWGENVGKTCFASDKTSAETSKRIYNLKLFLQTWPLESLNGPSFFWMFKIDSQKQPEDVSTVTYFHWNMKMLKRTRIKVLTIVRLWCSCFPSKYTCSTVNNN